METVTSSTILDRITEAVLRTKRGDSGGASWVWFHGMSDAEHLAFDLFLVRTKDELAWQAGTPFSRFQERVRRMATP